MKYIFGFLLIFPFTLQAQVQQLLIGTYTSTTSEGIYVYSFNSTDASSKFLSSAKASNPSFLAVSANQKFVYAVNENNPGTVSSFSFHKDSGTLTFLNSVETKGAHPCYISLDKKSKHAVVGNYSGGNLSVFDVNGDGTLSEAKQTIQHNGNSVNRQRQEKAHVHATVFSPDYKFLFVPDLGMDKLMIYKADSRTGMLTAAENAEELMNPGAGPRHLEFHPNKKFLFLIEELSGAVSVFKYEEGKLTLVQNISSHPIDFKGAKGSADIHVSPDGKFLYCSNRGDANSIAVFSINEETGILIPAGFQSTLGIHPRNFTIDPSGNFLLVANRDSDEVVVFKRDISTGMLTDTGQRIKVPRPVCLKWIAL
ncbi:MAG: lactonase family protein [Chitinophagaceae bacterium]|nr:lactonase family protein [Chitinophagaceae bacterium]